MRSRIAVRGVLLVLALLVATPLAAEAQPKDSQPRVGHLFVIPSSATAHLREAFRQGLRELGYVEGQNLIIEFRSADGRAERLPELATELVRLRVDVIVAAPDVSIRAAQLATRTIPIVMAVSLDDPGLVLHRRRHRQLVRVTVRPVVAPSCEEGDMSESEEMAAFFKERGFGVPLGFGDSPALLVIDLLRGFTDPAMPLGANLYSQVAQTVRLLGATREAEIPVYYTTVWYEEKDLRDGGVWVKKQWKGASTLKAGTTAVELDPRLGRRADEPNIVKKYAPAFFGTDLVSRLNARRLHTLANP